MPSNSCGQQHAGRWGLNFKLWSVGACHLFYSFYIHWFFFLSSPAVSHRCFSHLPFWPQPTLRFSPSTFSSSSLHFAWNHLPNASTNTTTTFLKNRERLAAEMPQMGTRDCLVLKIVNQIKARETRGKDKKNGRNAKHLRLKLGQDGQMIRSDRATIHVGTFSNIFDILT